MKIISSQRILRLSDKQEIHLPFGLSAAYKTALSNGQAMLTLNEDKILSLCVDERQVQIYPHYSRAINLPGLKNLTFSIISCEKDRRACATLITQEHYLHAPNRGIFFAIKCQDTIIACCIVDTLKFGNPKGRYHIDPTLADNLGLQPSTWSHATAEHHSILQDSLKLQWISRIARKPEYRGSHLGTTLIKETLRALPTILPFPVKNLEVIRTCDNQDLSTPDFLEHAGFHKAELRKQLAITDFSRNELFPKRRPCTKYYYWTKIENTTNFEVSRVFVPLANTPFKWFTEGRKTWELRRARGLFTTSHIYPGRFVELRRGYNTPQKIWGVINKVITGASINEVLEGIGDFKKVIPTASSISEASHIASTILQAASDSYIAFEITALFIPDTI